MILTMVQTGCTLETVKDDSPNKTVKGEVNNKKEATTEKEHSDKEVQPKQVERVEEEVVINTDLEPLYKLNEKNWTIEPIGSETNEKLILLTIDDAPDKFALDMAHTLKRNDVKAIFFINGHFLESDEKKKMVKAIFDLGFPIGNHTMTHSNLKELSKEDQYKEIVELNDQIEKITGERPKFFRAPFGSNTDYSKELATQEDMLLMNWTFGYDWEKEYMNKEELVNIMLNTPLLTNGANLLMHDREWTNAALEEIIKGLKQKDYEIVDPARIRQL